jgi:D-sedoheptulose 7-phosphate isomerase
MQASDSFAELGRLARAVDEDVVLTEAIEKAVCAVGERLNSGRTLFIAGNGGSAAEAQHFAAELVGRYKRERRGYPAVALTTDTSVLTAISNDYDFEKIFSRQLEALARADDVFLGLSTSGNSKNILKAVEVARTRKLFVINLLGRDGGQLHGLGDIDIIVPSNDTARIQELHLCILHDLCERLDATLLS